MNTNTSNLRPPWRLLTPLALSTRAAETLLGRIVALGHLCNSHLLCLTLFGLLLRLLPMPFTMQTDWRFVGDMVAMNAEGMKVLTGQWYPSGAYPPLAYYTMALFLFIFKPLMPIYPLATAAQPDPILAWAGSSLVFRYAFLMKVWYLVFDLGVALLLILLSSGSRLRSDSAGSEDPGAGSLEKGNSLIARLRNPDRANLRAFAFWMFNPLVIYGAYIHGEFDLAPTFFLTLSLYFAKKGQSRLAIFFLGIGACYKTWPLLLLPVALLILSRSWVSAAKLAILGAGPYVLLMAPRYLLHLQPASKDLGYYGTYLFPARMDIGFGQAIYLFVALYILIVWFAYGRSVAIRGPAPHHASPAAGRDGGATLQSDADDAQFGLLWRSMLAILLLYFAVSVAALHYYVWVMPLAALLFAADRRVLAPYLAMLAGVLLVSISIGRSLAAGLLTPISPLLFQSLPSPAEIVDSVMPVSTIVSLGRSVMAGTAAWIAYHSLTSLRHTTDPSPVSKVGKLAE